MYVYLVELGWSFTLGLGLLFESKNLSQRAAGETQRQQRAVGFVADLCCCSVMGQDVEIGHGLKICPFRNGCFADKRGGGDFCQLLAVAAECWLAGTSCFAEC